MRVLEGWRLVGIQKHSKCSVVEKHVGDEVRDPAVLAIIGVVGAEGEKFIGHRIVFKHFHSIVRPGKDGSVVVVIEDVDCQLLGCHFFRYAPIHALQLQQIAAGVCSHE